VTVYITHYAKDDLTDACAAAWLAQTSDVLVIDNGSPSPYAPSLPVKVIRLDVNHHLIKANNKGMQAAPSPWYFNVNNDVFPAPGCVARMLAIFQNPDVGIAAPGSSDEGAGILHVRPGESRDDVFTRHVDNHAWMFCQDVVDEIGWPDADEHPHWGNWYVNKVYCWKARRVGYKILAARSAYVEHRRAVGYSQEADDAGQAWLKARFAEQMGEIW
jgi:GT2 family glycosyltransferase